MNILSIGNSFSDDAQRYIHEIAKSDGCNIQTYNLFIGGCTLSCHYKNMLSDERAYNLGFNGTHTDFFVSLKEALINRTWDIITIQQASHESPYYNTYQPYLGKLAEFVRLCSPKSKLAFHQTWAYEQGKSRLSELGYTSHTAMFADIKASILQAAKDSDIDFIIPSGELLQALISSGIETVHRDGFHLNNTARYAVGLLWYAMLTDNDIDAVGFSDFDENIPAEHIEIIKNVLGQFLKSH